MSIYEKFINIIKEIGFVRDDNSSLIHNEHYIYGNYLLVVDLNIIAEWRLYLYNHGNRELINSDNRYPKTAAIYRTRLNEVDILKE